MGKALCCSSELQAAWRYNGALQNSSLPWMSSSG